MNIQTKSVTRSWNYFSISNKAREQRVGPRGKNFSCFSKNGHMFGGIHSNVVFEFSLGREETLLNSSFPSPPNLEDKVTKCIVVPAPIVRGLPSRTALWSVWLQSPGWPCLHLLLPGDKCTIPLFLMQLSWAGGGGGAAGNTFFSYFS